MTKRRIVVTGMGMVTPLGLTVAETWQNILAGKSGVARIASFDPSELPVQIAAEVKGFVPENYMAPKDVRKMDPFTQYGMAAAQQALLDSSLEVTPENTFRIGVAVGSGIGGFKTIIENCERFIKFGAKKVSPFFIPAGIINMLAGQISIRYGIKGPNVALVSACTTGTHNIGSAARIIAYGDADVMLAGGAEMGTTGLCLAGFHACRALSSRNDAPEKASRPFDQDRDGFVLGEGAGIVVLEEYEHAKKRGAKIYAELIGYAMTADAYHITALHESGEGAIASMRFALQDAKIAPEQVDYINAHATSTPLGDEIEASAIKKAFGEHAYHLAVSSTKSMTGHLLGATGAAEAIFSILAIRDNVAPPTINLDNSSPACDLNFVPHEAQARKIDICLSNSFGFGGTNGTLIFQRFLR